MFGSRATHSAGYFCWLTEVCGASGNTLYWVLLLGFGASGNTFYWVLLLVYLGPRATHFTWGLGQHTLLGLMWAFSKGFKIIFFWRSRSVDFHISSETAEANNTLSNKIIFPCINLPSNSRVHKSRLYHTKVMAPLCLSWRYNGPSLLKSIEPVYSRWTTCCQRIVQCLNDKLTLKLSIIHFKVKISCVMWIVPKTDVRIEFKNKTVSMNLQNADIFTVIKSVVPMSCGMKYRFERMIGESIICQEVCNPDSLYSVVTSTLFL
jgi:hypothetical protein